MLAIYALFWVISAFAVLPFGLRTHADVGSSPAPGHATSAPVNFRPRVVLLRATVVSAAFFALFYANFYKGWVTPADLDVSRWLGL
jgi:predicted secreted protein